MAAWSRARRGPPLTGPGPPPERPAAVRRWRRLAYLLLLRTSHCSQLHGAPLLRICRSQSPYPHFSDESSFSAVHFVQLPSLALADLVVARHAIAALALCNSQRERPRSIADERTRASKLSSSSPNKLSRTCRTLPQCLLAQVEALIISRSSTPHARRLLSGKRVFLLQVSKCEATRTPFDTRLSCSSLLRCVVCSPCSLPARLFYDLSGAATRSPRLPPTFLTSTFAIEQPHLRLTSTSQTLLSRTP